MPIPIVPNKPIKLDLKSQPVEIVANIPYFMTIGTFFIPPDAFNIGKIDDSVVDSITMMKQASSTKFYEVFNDHISLDLDIQFNAGQIVIPQNLNDDPSEVLCMVCSMKNIVIQSTHKPYKYIYIIIIIYFYIFLLFLLLLFILLFILLYIFIIVFLRLPVLKQLILIMSQIYTMI